jgi:nucleoside-diphosphate-sugar epimerase
MKKVIVFGSSGFVGNALCIYLIEKGYVVDGCDLLNTSQAKLNFFF